MAETVQCVPGTQRINYFGVRHLSPASAHHLLRVLERARPECVLIEGPSDASDLLPHLAGPEVRPPVALIAYTTQSPVRSVLYPLAEYSPEYQAIRWAIRHRAAVRFIDLPATASIRYDRRIAFEEPETQESMRAYLEHQSRFYSGAAAGGGETDYETFWERHFEHCMDTDAFIQKIAAMSEALRDCTMELQWASDKSGASYNLIREAYMKRQIQAALSEGYAPDKIVVVTGSYHLTGLRGPALPMSDEEFASLPRDIVNLTLMPYSYYRLSSQSGYGAGNKAPAYFQLLWEHIQAGGLDGLVSVYLALLGETMREGGQANSTASVIEAVRLSQALASMRESGTPTLRDLHDSAICLLGGGELSAMVNSFARIDVGTAIGSLPEGVAQTPAQTDMNRQLTRLRLEKYKSTVAQELLLDLREKRTVQNRDSAFLDLNRSVFFHRLALLGIRFCRQSTSPDASAWAEKWVLQWTPEAEIEIVEASLKGETIENAAAFTLKERFEATDDIVMVARLIRLAFAGKLLKEAPNGVARIQVLCSDGSNFTALAAACREISDILQYRDVRGVDTAPLLPIMEQLFLKSSLVFFDGAGCDDEAATAAVVSIDHMHRVSQEQPGHVDDELWLQKLRAVAMSDDRNAKLSGVSAALLMERGRMTDEDFGREVSRRLSYGVPGDLAAQWFEGLCARNRYVLLSHIGVWQQLDDYLDGQEPGDFKRSLVFLRRAFGTFSAREKNSIVEILAELWHVDAGSAGEFLLDELTAEQQESLSSLGDFDFDF